MEIHAFRLLPGQDLKKELLRIVRDHRIGAGCVLACVGSLSAAKLRTADERILELDEDFEIISLVGTLCQDDVHLHLSLADKEGRTVGGHLKEGCAVRTTAEIVLGEFQEISFSRRFDEHTGYSELLVHPKS